MGLLQEREVYAVVEHNNALIPCTTLLQTQLGSFIVVCQYYIQLPIPVHELCLWLL